MSDAYGFVFKHVIYPLWESGIRHRPTLRYLEELERSQWRSLDELQSIQVTAMRGLLAHAFAHVPYYRQRLKQAGVVPEDFAGLDDLRALPLLTREDAARSFEERKSTAPPLPEIAKMTSGSSGRPLSFGYDWDSEHRRQAVKLRGYGWAGYGPGDRSLHYWGTLATFYEKPLRQRLKVEIDHRLRREHYLDCTDRSDEALERVVDEIRVRKPDVIVCYAQAGAALARHVVTKGLRDWRTIPVLCCAERAFPADREMLEKAFGPAVFETYGSREVMLIAAECPAHDGMHVSMENLIVELVVRDGDFVRPAEPGEIGEVVVTDLHNYGMPFIRYLTGDLAVEKPPGRCACGRALVRLASVEGRTNDTLRDAAGRAVSGMMFNVIFSVLADKVQEFQVVQRKDRSIDLLLVAGRAFDQGVLELVCKSCERFLHGVEVRAELVEQIPLGKNGKRRVVIVEQ